MTLRFNEAKATQAAAHLLRLRGRRMKYLKLIKLLYIADREALARWGKPITTDRYVAMKEGPVVSNIYNLIGSEPPPYNQSIWHAHIVTVSDWDVELVSDPASDELSLAEEKLLNEVFEIHGHKNRWVLVTETHKFSEWKDPGTSSTHITYREILKAVNKSHEEVSATLEELKSIASAQRVLHPA
ncbi:MAG: Panacea domain-containing protein [Bryobacteraceae bacterium]